MDKRFTQIDGWIYCINFPEVDRVPTEGPALKYPPQGRGYTGNTWGEEFTAGRLVLFRRTPESQPFIYARRQNEAV